MVRVMRSGTIDAGDSTRRIEASQGVDDRFSQRVRYRSSPHRAAIRHCRHVDRHGILSILEACRSKGDVSWQVGQAAIGGRGKTSWTGSFEG